MPEATAGRPAAPRGRPAVVLALDAGQSGVRARVSRAEEAGEAAPVVREGGVRPLDALGAVAEIASVLGAAADAAGAGGPDRLDVVGISLSGFAPRAAAAGVLGRALLDRLGAARVIVAHDAVCAHLGALAGRPGVVAAVGTGSVVLGLGPDGEEARVDGAGHLLGDAGSAFAIGRRGLEAALRAHDGRGEAEALRLRAVARFGSLDELPVGLYGAPSPVREVASFAPDVAAAARAGDPTARAIWAEAASEVAHSVLAAARRTHPAGAEVAVCLLGGLFADQDGLLRPVLAHVGAAWPQARPTRALGTALDGAERLARGARGPFGAWIRAYRAA